MRPPPAKWHGLEDTEIRYRQRYLDLMANPEVKDVFLKRSEIIAEIRNFLHARGFVEVETPMMQAIPGGAAAQPFKTHHNALGCDFYLRIALELPLKRMLVGGVDKVFEIGRVFRNEGLSRKHNPEFTMLEAYQAFGDYESMMELVQAMICHVAQKVLGTLKVRQERKTSVHYLINKTVEVVGSFYRTKAKAMTLPPDSAKEMIKFAELISANEFKLLAELEKSLKETSSHVIASKTLGMVEKFKNQISQEHLIVPAPHGPNIVVVRSTLNDLESIIQYLQPLTEEIVIDLTPNWKRAKYKDLVREKVSEKTNGKVSDWFALTSEERRRIATQDLKLAGDIGTNYEDFEVTEAVFEKLIEPTLIQPDVRHASAEGIVPLAKLSPDDPTTVEVFECCINGQEIAPAYTEQNDPIEQRERLEHQAGGEQQKLDEDFLVALEHGMPPAGGMGMGIDRLCMMLLGQESIRDVILFPQLKPK